MNKLTLVKESEAMVDGVEVLEDISTMTYVAEGEFGKALREKLPEAYGQLTDDTKRNWFYEASGCDDAYFIVEYAHGKTRPDTIYFNAIAR